MDIAQRFFHHTTPQFGTLKLYLREAEQKMTRSQNRHFHFNHKQKTVKSVGNLINLPATKSEVKMFNLRRDELCKQTATTKLQ